MKRGREDGYTQGPKRTRVEVSSRGETNGQPLTNRGEGNKSELTANDAHTYLKTVREIFQDNKEKYDAFLAIMKDFRAQKVSTEGVIVRIKELFKGYTDLLLGFNTFLPEDYKITLVPEEKEPKMKVDFKDAIGFVTKIKARFGDDEYAYKRFLDILNLYRRQRKTISEVYEEVTALFKGHKDLLGEFVNFLPNESTPATCPRSARKAVLRDKGTAIHLDKKKKLRIKLEDHSEHSDEREDGDENLVACSADSLVKEGQPGYLNGEDNGGIQDAERDTDRTEKGAASGSKDPGNHTSPLSTTKYMGTPINELDLSECTQCTPSYRLLPKDYQVEIPSYRNALGKKTLNDHLVSVTSGSEDYSFNHMRKNQYEESLFRCEDDRFEMDMLLGSVSSAITHVENLLEKIDKDTIPVDTTTFIKKHLSAIDLRCIERLYGDNGLDVMDLLKKNMHSALPVILTRLKQKQDEWGKCRTGFQKVWAEVYAKNHHKSLDHRSFYFKQQDSKNLSTKCLVAEIKDISEKKYQEDLLHAIAVKTMPSFTPDLEFTYCDTHVHEDLYQLIRYYCEELCGTEQSDKVMKLWTTFLEPTFSILSRSEDVSKFNKDNEELDDECLAVKKKDNPTVHAALTDEVIQSSKLVSPRYEKIVDGENHRINEVGKHEVKQEEGESSPTESYDKEGASCTETGAKSSARTEDGKKENCRKLSEDSVAEEVDKVNEGEDGSAFSEQFLQTVKPVAKHVCWPLQASETGSQNDSRVFYGNDSYYVLFRLHQMLYERIQLAKKHSEKKWKAPDNTTPDSFPRFIDALYKLLDGSCDNTKYEDECRAIFGAQSYVLFTLDKLVQKFVKHLHSVASDETDNKLLQLYAYENFRKPGRSFDLVYHENAHALLHEANIYRIRYSSAESRLSIQLMNRGNNQPEVTGAVMEPGFVDYLQNEFLTCVDDEEKQGIFLKRNKKKFTGLDESSEMSVAMEGLNIINEMELKMACSSSKVKYVKNTSDFLYRSKQRKPNSKRPRRKGVSEISKERRISRFHIMLNCRLFSSPSL